jgi:hypothetical protein
LRVSENFFSQLAERSASLALALNYFGYIGELCRMGCVGKTDSEREDLLCWPGYKAK